MNNEPIYKRSLHRSLTDRYVAGVLGGIAETYGWNPTLIRLVYVASCIFCFPLVFLYIAAWILMPEA